MQDQKTAPPVTDPGFKLPGQTQQTTPQDPLPKTAPDTANQPVEIAPGGATNPSAAPLRDTSGRDLAIGGAVFLEMLAEQQGTCDAAICAAFGDHEHIERSARGNEHRPTAGSRSIRGAPQLAAIVDWELVTLGDPLLDLGHVLSLWPDRNIPVSKWFADTLPSADDVIDRYAQVTGRDMSEFAWYRVLACYRLGLILEGTHARACAGLAPKDVGDMLHATTVALLERALELIG